MRLMPAVLAVLLPAAALALDGHYQVSLRTELRPRTLLPGDNAPPPVTGDLEFAPLAELTLGGDITAFTAQYAPTLIWREPQIGGQLLPLNRGRLALTHRWSQATLLISEDAAYGTADVGSLRPAEGSLPTDVAGVQTLGPVDYVRSASLLALEARPGSRNTLSVSAGWNISGSTTSTALPLQYGPTAATRWRWAASRNDGLTTAATLVSARFATGQEQLISQLTETWDRQLTHTLTMSVGGGVAVTREVVIAAQGIPGTYLEVLPVGNATLSWQDSLFDKPFRFDTSVRLAPFADRFTGFVYERIEGRVQGEWRAARSWLATLAAGGALAVPIGRSEQNGDRLVFGEGRVGWDAFPWLQFQASARILWTEQPRLGDPGLVQAAGVLSITVREQDSFSW